MHEATLVYPFDFHFLPLIRNNLLPKKFKVQHLISPNGWGFTNKDAGTIDHGEPLNIIVSGEFDDKVKECSNLFITQYDKGIDKEISIFPKIQKAISLGKNIYCTLELTDAELDSFSKKAATRNVSFTYYCNNLKNYEKEKKAIYTQVEHRNIETPVIMVFGLLEQVGKFDIQIRLAQFLRNLGYKVSLISSRGYGTLFNEYSIPSFMFNRNFTEYEKIILFNNYIKSIEQKEKPDIFIIGVPGGLMPINNRYLNHYGMTALELTSAIQPDASIICTHCENFGKDYFLTLDPVLEYKFSISNKSFFIDNTFIDFSSHSKEGFDLMKVDPALLDLSELCHVYKNIFSYKNMTTLFEETINQLADDNDICIA